MADVKYRVREFTPKAGQAGSHSFFAEAVTDNVITNRELAADSLSPTEDINNSINN